MASLFAEGDEVLVPVMGKFSGRWADICRAYGIKVQVMEIEPGHSPGPEDIRWALVRNDRISGVLLTHCETSTGALTDLKGISEGVASLEKAGRVILRVADCVSSFCVDDLKVDEWGLDCVITASHKGLLSPAGLSAVAVGGRAAAAMERVPARGFYLDLRRYFARAFRELNAVYTGAVVAVCCRSGSRQDQRSRPRECARLEPASGAGRDAGARGRGVHDVGGEPV